jgi:phosphate transport system protein
MEHTIKAFDKDIDALRTAFASMGGLVQVQLKNALACLHSPSRERKLDLVNEVLEDEAQVNDLHTKTDLACHRVIAKHQPMAVDLREIIAILHAINDLERVGDECKKIALRSRGAEFDLPGNGLDLPEHWATDIGDRVADMLQSSINAFMRRDTKVSAVMKEQDIQVDKMRDALIADLMQRIAREPASVSQGLGCILMVQSIERVGDHAKNLADYVVQMVEGLDRRH